MPGCLTACCLSRVLVPLKRAQAKSQKHQINLVQLISLPFPFVYTYKNQIFICITYSPKQLGINLKKG